MPSPDNLANLRAVATAARQRGCAELAEEIELLLEAAALVCGGLPCLRCGGDCGEGELTGAVIKVSFGSRSRRPFEARRGTLCDECCDLLSAWAPGLA